MRIDYETQQDISLETELTYLFRKDKGLELSGYKLDHIESTKGSTASVWPSPLPFRKKNQGRTRRYGRFQTAFCQ